MQIIVLGMHRAGTSAVTRVINLMGAAIGSSTVVGGPAFDNEKGFWERTDVSKLNDDLLGGCGGTWDDVSAVDPAVFSAWESADHRRRANTILADLETRRPWVIKDPRLCLTLGFWRPLLEAPIYVFPYRSPIEIARSLAARNGLSMSHGVALWERYTLSALELAVDAPRVGISYPDLIDDPIDTVRRLYEALQAAGATGLRHPHEREIVGFVDGRLHHQQDSEQLGRVLLNAQQKQLAAALADGSALGWPQVPALSQSADDILQHVHAQRLLRRDLAERDTALDESRESQRALVQARDERGRELSALRERCERMNAELTAAQANHRHAEDALAALQTQFTERTASVRALKAEVSVRDARLDDLAGEIATLSRWLGDVEAAVTATLDSWRWRVGDRAVRAVERTLLRPRPTLAADHLQAVFREIGRWRKRQAERKALAPSPAPSAGSADPGGIGRVCDARKGTGYSVLCLPIIDWSFRFQRPQQLARQFVQDGHHVYYAALEFSDALAQDEIEPGVTGLQLPGHVGRNVYQSLPSETEIAAQLGALSTLAAEAEREIAVCLVQLPFWGPLAEALREQLGCALVYDCMDDHEGFATNASTMLDAERRLLEGADLVVASSQLLLDKVEPVARRSMLVRNGVDAAHFGRVPALAHAALDRLTIGYYGAIADWFDSGLVGEVARLRPNWHLVLIGHTFGADLDPLQQPNVSLPGEQPYRELPRLIRDWDCCLIPFRRVPLTEATNPVKVYEMLAAGKPVVAVPLPELLPLAEEGHIALAESATAFVAAIESAVVNDSRARQESRRAFAHRNTWERRYAALSEGVSRCFPLVSVIIVTYNNVGLNRQCLAGVLRDTDYPNLEVIVVDNGSTDGTPDLLRDLARDHACLSVVLNADNKGFAAANNQALAIAKGDYLCLLNNDTVVSGRWLSTLVRHLQHDPELGLVGPVTNAIGNEAQIDVGYIQVEEMPAWAANYCRSRRSELSDISMLAFFCVLMPRRVYEQVGPLDEQFGLGMFEDDDYNARVRSAGFKVKLAQDSFVHHWQRASFKLLGEKHYLRIYEENQRRYRAKLALEPKQLDRIAALRARCEQATTVILFAPSIGWNVELIQRPHHLANAVTRLGGVAVFDCTGSSVDDVDLLREEREGLYLFQGAPALLRDLDHLVIWTFSYNFGYRDHFSRGTPTVYDYIDDLSVFPYDQHWLAALHQRAVVEADVVAAVARNLHQELAADRTDALYLPNAVDAAHFHSAPRPNPASNDPGFVALAEGDRPLAGYYGALARWFDYGLVAELCRMRTDWNFVLIGPDLDGSLAASGLTQITNLHWLGPKPYDALPGYAHAFDAAIIPFEVNEITLATSPLKLFEYFAAGRGVVTSAMPECEAFPDTLIGRNVEDFAAHLDEARRRSIDPDYQARVRAVAEDNSWQQRVEAVLRALNH